MGFVTASDVEFGSVVPAWALIGECQGEAGRSSTCLPHSNGCHPAVPSGCGSFRRSRGTANKQQMTESWRWKLCIRVVCGFLIYLRCRNTEFRGCKGGASMMETSSPGPRFRPGDRLGCVWPGGGRHLIGANSSGHQDPSRIASTLEPSPNVELWLEWDTSSSASARLQHCTSCSLVFSSDGPPSRRRQCIDPRVEPVDRRFCGGMILNFGRSWPMGRMTSRKL